MQILAEQIVNKNVTHKGTTQRGKYTHVISDGNLEISGSSKLKTDHFIPEVENIFIRSAENTTSTNKTKTTKGGTVAN